MWAGTRGSHEIEESGGQILRWFGSGMVILNETPYISEVRMNWVSWWPRCDARKKAVSRFVMSSYKDGLAIDRKGWSREMLS